MSCDSRQACRRQPTHTTTDLVSHRASPAGPLHKVTFRVTVTLTRTATRWFRVTVTLTRNVVSAEDPVLKILCGRSAVRKILARRQLRPWPRFIHFAGATRPCRRHPVHVSQLRCATPDQAKKT